MYEKLFVIKRFKMIRALLFFCIWLLSTTKARACDCADKYDLVCETSCSNGLQPVMHELCPCCSTCPKMEYEQCGGPYYSKGRCNHIDDADGIARNGEKTKVPELFCSEWGSYECISKDDLLTHGKDIIGTCLRKVCVKVCSDHTPASGTVCGTDGREYTSACHLKQQNNCYIEDTSDKVKVDKKKTNCPCYGITCEGAGEKCRNGECVCKDEGNCDDFYQPVCGSNGVLYQSQCHAEVAMCKASQEEKFIISNETCEEMGKCQNECNGQGQICEIKSGRLIDCVCKPSVDCQDELPVFCASNNHTYTSRCFMDAHACDLQQEVTFKHTGACNSDQPTSSGLSSPPMHINE